MDISGTIYNQLDKAEKLHHVEGFDPLWILTDKSGEFDLDYQNMWFRLAYPSGGIQIVPIKIEDNQAIIQCNVYFDGPVPNSSNIASCSFQPDEKGSRKVTPNLLKLLENKAVSGALAKAGFGCQFMNAKNTRPTAPPQRDNIPAGNTRREEKKNEQTKKSKTDTVPPKQDTAEKEAPAELPGQASGSGSKQESAEQAAVDQGAQPAQESIVDPLPALTQTENVKYNADMPVEEIMKLMTYEDALSLTVQLDRESMVNGKTIRWLVDNRYGSLRWLSNQEGVDNIILAAIQVVFAHHEMRAA